MPAENKGMAPPTRVSVNDIDRVLAGRIAQARVTAGLNQGDLSKRIGISSQQISKIERAVNRCPASRLWQIAVATKQPMSFFFDGMDPQDGMEEEEMAAIANSHRTIMEMLNLYQRASPSMRRHVMGVLREGVSARPAAPQRTA